MVRPYWSHVPPSPVGARLWSPPPGFSTAVLLGPWSGLWLHWTGSRSVPCLGDECPKSRHIRPGKWCGYIPIARPIYNGGKEASHLTWQVAVLAINNEQAHQLGQLVADIPNVGLEIEREKGGRGWTLLKCSRIKPIQGLPKSPDVLAVVARLFGLISWEDDKSLPPSNGETPPFSDQQ